jgi:Domain of unknown function (DUF4214)
MLKGYLDAVTSSGHIEGWAYDSESPSSPLTVSIIADDGRELGQGIAGNFREDLLNAGHAAGWCAFRIKLTRSTTGIRSFGLVSIDRSAQPSLVLHQAVPYVVSEEAPIRTVADLVAADPTQIGSLDQLRGCDDLFNRFVKAQGIDAFVRAAYLYLLHRPADASGHMAYKKHLRSKKVTPYGLLLAIADSDEYRSRSRQHFAPTNSGFPFRVS